MIKIPAELSVKEIGPHASCFSCYRLYFYLTISYFSGWLFVTVATLADERSKNRWVLLLGRKVLSVCKKPLVLVVAASTLSEFSLTRC